MKTYIKGFIFLNLLFLLLILVCQIPKETISKNINNSLIHFKEHNQRYNMFTIQQSQDDIIADANTLNILYHMDNDIQSILLCNYYQDNNHYSLNLINSVENNLEENTEYSRYWHGNMILYRILFTLTSISNIKIIMFTIYLLFNILFIYICIKKQIVKFFISYFLATILTTSFFNFVSLEYIPIYLISIIGCILLTIKKDTKLIFLLLGISTAFFDFLTIETISLTLPLLCYLFILNKNNIKISFKDFSLLNINWLIGYSCTYMYKWFLTSIICQENYFIRAFEKGINRTYDNNISFLIGLKLNVQMLFPFINKNSTAVVLFIFILTIFFIIFYLLHKKGVNKNNIITYFICIFTIPYLRYIILSNHSFEHYFFTYRAQISSILVLLLMCFIGIDFTILKRRK